MHLWHIFSVQAPSTDKHDRMRWLRLSLTNWSVLYYWSSTIVDDLWRDGNARQTVISMEKRENARQASVIDICLLIFSSQWSKFSSNTNEANRTKPPKIWYCCNNQNWYWTFCRHTDGAHNDNHNECDTPRSTQLQSLVIYIISMLIGKNYNIMKILCVHDVYSKRQTAQSTTSWWNMCSTSFQGHINQPKYYQFFVCAHFRWLNIMVIWTNNHKSRPLTTTMN